MFYIICKLVLTLFSASVISRFTDNGLRVVGMKTDSLEMGKLSLVLFNFCAMCSSLFLTLKGKGRNFVLKTYERKVYFIPIVLILPVV